MSKYIVFEGMDGSGKGTQIKLLQEKLSGPVVFTREPGGTPFAEEIRKIVRDNPLAGKSTALNNFLLFWAAREELQHNLVVPALRSGKHVFSDRSDSSTYAFQICGEEHKELVHLFNLTRKHIFLNRQPPDLYIIFDLPAEVARERVMQDANREANHFDVRDLAYYKRVREGFREFAEHMPVEFIDATRSPEAIHRSVLIILAKRMIIPELAFVVE
ncbi:MAG: dTMP kinase [Minisyncoccota bacterium]